jgi:type VI secretion system secreted protein VgrG
VEEHDVSAEANKDYVVTAVNHSAMDTSHTNTARPSEYNNTFNCIPQSVTFRPPRVTPRAMVMGPQTAVVVGPKGQEIYTDKYGRIKVQFFWDREGKKDENSSCWMRVAEMWAGKNWGMVATPRIGQEVVVEFLEGDPDKPLVTGRVYNAEQMPPYKLPDKKNLSGVKSNSTLGGGGYNELYFDDSKGQELMNIHAQKDMNTLVLNNDTQAVNADREILVKKDQREEVDGTHHLTVKGDRNEKVTGTESLDAGANFMCKVGQVYVLDSGMEVHIKAGMKMVLEAMDLTIMSGGNFVNVGPAGVSIVGTLVNINSGGAAGQGSDCNPTAPDEPKAAQKLSGNTPSG